MPIKMDYGNEVDLSNNNITPLWKKRTTNTGSRDLKLKSRPLSYQIDGVHTTDFPVEDKCAFTLTQPAEKIVAKPAGSTMVLKHVLNKPSRKTRIVRSISIGHSSNGRLSFSKRREDNKQCAESKANLTAGTTRMANGASVCVDGKHSWADNKNLSSPHTVTSQRDQIVFGDSASSPDHMRTAYGTPPHNLSVAPQCHRQDSGASSPSLRTSSRSSSSSVMSLSSTPSSLSDPPTPRTPSPDDGVSVGGVLLHQTPKSSPVSDGKLSPSVVLSTQSLAALKMGTQQLIPQGLVSDTRPLKTGHSGAHTKGPGGLLDPGQRALRARSMVETGSFFATSTEQEAEGEDSPGLLRRGLRSTSYRRAVVSGVELDESPTDLKTKRLSQPVLRGVVEDREHPSSPGKIKSPVQSPDKKKGIPSQRTFDSEEDEVLYQNYQEKALHNDSDEDAESREPKPDDRIVVQYKPIRTSWSQLSVVKKSGATEKLSPEERKRQEAIFEVISSEHSYLHSLEILIRLFKNSSELGEIMTKTESHHLFSNIVDVCEASKKFFKELEDRHQQNIVIDDISDIVERHAQSNFDPYITYCSNEVYQQRTLQRLVMKSPSFKEVLTRIEAHPDCRNLPMISFLILPMQRVTRLPLLMDTICHKTPKNTEQYEACKKAFQEVSKVVRKCNEGARTMERTEMMYTINSQLEFKIKPFPLVSSSRWMVKRGELTALVEENGIFLKRTSRQQVYFFLFNDVLILTRKKSEESYTVIDYALRDQIWVGPCQAEDLNLSPVRTTASMLTSRQGPANHLFRLQFSSNHSGDKVPMVLGVEQLNERARWISALGLPNSDKNNTDRTNLVQMEVTRTYTARQPDELSLQVAEVVLVSQMVDDGWYEGERLRDGERGWFLAECAERITCQATIERNWQRMDRLQGLETNV
ncbi:rho guanine nucleotide exchange factor 26-like [Alosa sapidissima]|uniref:rho guanine nucleotide exchange factor 26-like n=1 Tax=Alosa sapidissima TaxID=34773 RepID=UPI001C0883D5|nr:rho guanine nucleotide exchange factor 26-like [Alosa sapidissima]